MPSFASLFDLTGKTALITGGAGWLGSALSHVLASAGANVIIASRDADRGADMAASLPKAEGQHHYCVILDHMDAHSLDTGFQQATRCTGSIDILVNNGLEALGRDLTSVTFDEFARHQINNAGYFCLARHLRDHLVLRQAKGSVVMIGSMYGLVGSYPDVYAGVSTASPVAYHALKGGTLQMVRHLAVYWAKDGVRVNGLSPGPFPKDNGIPETMRQRLIEKSPMGRMGRPEELQGALLLLVSDAGSYITGHNLVVDGGWTAW